MVRACAFVLILLHIFFYFYNLSKIRLNTMKKQKKLQRMYNLNTLFQFEEADHIYVHLFVWGTSPELIFMERFSYIMWHITWYVLISSWISWFTCSLHNLERWCWIQLTFLLCGWMELRGYNWRAWVQSLVLPSYVALGKFHDLLEPQFLTSKMGKIICLALQDCCQILLPL